MALFDKGTYTREELLQRVGSMEQLARVKLHRLAEGHEDGTLAADVTNSSGFAFTAVASRGLDISTATYKGHALAWRSAQTDRHPAHYEPSGLGWLRSFPGGLLTTCGLTWMGAPDIDDGVELGLHGRYSNTPATSVCSRAQWVNDDYVLSLEGEVREAVVFGSNVVLRRRIETTLGRPGFTLRDTVTNEGFETAPHMLLYHINLGYPLVDVGARVILPAARTTPRDADAEEGAERWPEIEPPVAGCREKVYFHTLDEDSDGWARAALVNPGLADGVALSIRYRPEELPCFVQWKMMGAGTYVVGLEPANALVLGRSAERSAGRLQSLEPDETRRYHLEIDVLEGPDALALMP